jgi:hypothetical protein
MYLHQNWGGAMTHNPEICNICPILEECEPDKKGYVTQYLSGYAVCNNDEV